MNNILLFPIDVCKYLYIGIRTIFFIFIRVCLLTYRTIKIPFSIKPKQKADNNKINIDEEIENPVIIKDDIMTEEIIEPEKINVEIIPEDINTDIIPEEENNTEIINEENVLENTIVNKVVLSKKQIAELKKLRLFEQKRLKNEALKNNKNTDENEKLKHKQEIKAAKINLKNKMNESYINEKVKMEKPSVFGDLNEFFKKINNIPNWIKEKFTNNEFVRHNKNKDVLKREALLINFEGADAEKSDVKILFEYMAKNPEGRVVKDYFEAFSKVEVHSFLLSEGFEVYSIKTSKWIQFVHKNANMNNTKIKIKDLVFFITQLSTYVKAGIPLVESLRILEKQYKNRSYKKIFKSIIYDLTMGENFSEALLKQNVAFPKLLINMVKTAEMTGELPEVLDDMADYYTESEKTRKQMITALMYPSMVFVFATGVIIFIMMYVVPQFVDIYESMDASKIPAFTLAVIGVSSFLKSYAVVLLIGIIITIILNIYLYRNIKIYRTICQFILMKLPILGNTIIYNEVTMFTKTLGSLLSHNVFITESMEVLNKITNNEIYKMLILDTMTNLSTGNKISDAFQNHWAFPAPAYEMLVTGEKTGELPEMMAKVSSYYQELHKQSVTRIKTFVEPLLTVFLTVIVGLIIMAIIIPMFGMYSSIQSY